MSVDSYNMKISSRGSDDDDTLQSTTPVAFGTPNDVRLFVPTTATNKDIHDKRSGSSSSIRIANQPPCTDEETQAWCEYRALRMHQRVSKTQFVSSSSVPIPISQQLHDFASYRHAPRVCSYETATSDYKIVPRLHQDDRRHRRRVHFDESCKPSLILPMQDECDEHAAGDDTDDATEFDDNDDGGVFDMDL